MSQLFSNPVVWVFGGIAVFVGVFLLIRRHNNQSGDPISPFGEKK